MDHDPEDPLTQLVMFAQAKASERIWDLTHEGAQMTPFLYADTLDGFKLVDLPLTWDGDVLNKRAWRNAPDGRTRVCHCHHAITDLDEFVVLNVSDPAEDLEWVMYADVIRDGGQHAELAEFATLVDSASQA
jgi:hypothetical protein